MRTVLETLLEAGYINTGRRTGDYLILVRNRHEVLYDPKSDMVLSPNVGDVDPDNPCYRDPGDVWRGK